MRGGGRFFVDVGVDSLRVKNNPAVVPFYLKVYREGWPGVLGERRGRKEEGRVRERRGWRGVKEGSSFAIWFACGVEEEEGRGRRTLMKKEGKEGGARKEVGGRDLKKGGVVSIRSRKKGEMSSVMSLPPSRWYRLGS